MKMLVRKRIYLFSLLILLCCHSRWHRVDQLFEMYDQPNAPGAAMMVIKDGKAILKKTYGLAHVERGVPVTSNTNFRLASVTKQFTAVCILMLMEMQQLTLEQTLKDIFPDFPDYGRQITVRHLLTHTSGLIDYEDLIPESATSQVLDRDVLRLMMAQDSTYFEPGTQYRYCNSGYAVLAMIVEKTSGQSFAAFLKSRIFDPLGMSGTVAFENGISEVSHRAYGYAHENGTFIFRDQSPTSAVLGDGGIYSSMEDLYRWDQALYTDGLVTSPTLALAFTPAVLADGTPLDYGFGWRIDTYRGHQRLHHTGQTCGFTTIIQRYPQLHFSIIILTNRHEPMLTELANAVADLYLSQS